LMLQKQLREPLVLKVCLWNCKKKGKKWYEELREERVKDIETEML
jgi:hypothetical protein